MAKDKPEGDYNPAPITDFVITNPCIELQQYPNGRPKSTEYKDLKFFEYVYDSNWIWGSCKKSKKIKNELKLNGHFGAKNED